MASFFKKLGDALTPSGSLTNAAKSVGLGDTVEKRLNIKVNGTGVRVRDLQDVGFNTKSSVSVWNDFMGNVSGQGNLDVQHAAYDVAVQREGMLDARANAQAQAVAQQQREAANRLALEGSQSGDTADVQVGGSADIALGVATASGRRRRTGSGSNITVGV